LTKKGKKHRASHSYHEQSKPQGLFPSGKKLGQSLLKDSV